MAGVAQLKAMVGMDSRAYRAGSRDVQNENSKLLSSFKNIGTSIGAAFTIGAITKFTADVVASTGELALFAEQANVSVARFEQLGRVVQDTGEDLDTLRDALGAIKTAQGEVLRGEEGMLKEFEALGITLDEIGNMSVDEIFARLGQRIIETGNSAKDFSAIAKILGEGDALKLQQAMKAAAQETGELDYELQRAAVASDKLGQSFKRAGETFKKWFAKKVVLPTKTFLVGREAIGKEVEARQNAIKLEKDLRKEQLKRAKEIFATRESDKKQKEEDQRLKLLEQAKSKEEAIAKKREKFENDADLAAAEFWAEDERQEKEKIDRLTKAVKAVKALKPYLSGQEQLGAAFGGDNIKMFQVSQAQKAQAAREELVQINKEQKSQFETISQKLDALRTALK